MDMVKMERNLKRIKVEKKSIDEQAMRNAFEKVNKNIQSLNHSKDIQIFIRQFFVLIN